MFFFPSFIRKMERVLIRDFGRENYVEFMRGKTRLVLGKMVRAQSMKNWKRVCVSVLVHLSFLA